MKFLGKLKRKKKEPKVIVRRPIERDENAVYDWITGEEIGEIRKAIVNKENVIIAYEIKYLAGNIVQHPADQLEATSEGYILLPIWLKKGKSSCGRLVDAKKRLDELRRMLDKNAISLETFNEMAKVTFNLNLVRESESSIVEVDTHLDELMKEKLRIEQEIYSLDIKRRVGLIGRVEYAEASLDLTDAYKRTLAHIEEVKELRNSLVKTLTRIKEMEEIPEEEIEKIKSRKYEIRITL
ncbi:MAG: hypothetical protein ACE5NN_02930 [Candidatus Bathyarchaeia archaeon]